MTTLFRAHIAKESYCLEQRKHDTVALEKLENIKNVVEECDDLKKKLERSQEELNQLKKENELFKPLCIHQDQSSETEKDTDNLSIYNLTPKAKTQIITRDMQIKKKFTDQLANAHKENLILKEKLSNLEYLFGKLGICDFSSAYIEELQIKLKCLKEITRERDNLKNKVEILETQLSSYNYVLEDIEVFKQRSLLLDEVLHDRDRLSKRVEQLRGLDEEVINLRKKALRVDQLEDDLRKLLKDKKIVEEEVDRLRGKCSITEIQVLTQKAEGDELQSKLVCMEHEIENLKGVSMEKQRLIEERDHLQQNLEELVRMQGEFEHMKKQMKCLEILKAERDMFKSKYENLIGLECECDILRTQVEKGKIIEKERETLENQVDDLQTCIFEQETEIRRLVGHIDILAKGRDEQQENLKEVIINIRAELEQKDILIVSAEEKLATLQKELGNSINGLSTETIEIKIQNEKLEKLIEKYENKNTELKENITVLLKNNENLTIQIKDIMNENNFLLTKVEEKENSLKTLKEVLHDHEYILDEFQKIQFCSRDDNLRDIETETDELNLITTVAKEESITVQEKLTRISKIAGDNHFQQLLLHSKQAVQKIANELEKQYNDWDCFKTKLGNYGKNNVPGRLCSCNKDMYIGYCFTNDTGIRDKCQRRRCMRALRKRKLSKFHNQEISLTKDYGRQDNFTGIEQPYSVLIQTDSPGKLISHNGSLTEVECEDKREIYTDDNFRVKSKKIQTSEDASTFIGDSLSQLFENNGNEVKDNQKEEEAEAFESARSLDCVLCKNLGERLQILERELSTTNDTLIQLQDKLDRTAAENDALRRHSAEVQEVAKDQIKNLVELLKDSKEKCYGLEKESNKLTQSNCTILLEKDQLLNDIIRLQKEKDDLQKTLANNIVTSNENKELRNEIIKFKKLEKVLNKFKPENDLIESFQMENTTLKKTISAQFKEISKLLDKIKTPTVSILVKEDTIDPDQDIIKNHINNLENQLKQLEEITKTELLSENVHLTINDLIKKLEMEESKAEIRENTLKHVRATDPAALLNVEVAKLKQKICSIEQDNSKLQDVILQKNIELESQINVFNIIQVEKNKLLSEVLKLQEENAELKRVKEEYLKLEIELQNNANELKNASEKISCLLVDIGTLKEKEVTYLKENQYLINETTRLKGQLDATLKSLTLSSLRFSELQDETAKLNLTHKQLEGDNINLKKDLENTVTSAQGVTERLNQVINENIILKDINLETAHQLANVKNVIENTILEAQKSCTERDNQIQMLKDQVTKCESENDTLKKDLEEAANKLTKNNDEICQVSQKLTLLYKENVKLKNDVYSSKAGEGDNNLKSLLNKLETENADLTKEVNIGLKNLNEANNSILENKNKISKLEWNVSLLETENENLKTELQDYFKEISKKDDTLKQKVSQLEENNRKLKQDIDKKYNEHEKDLHNQDDDINLKMTPVDQENDIGQITKKYEDIIIDLKKTISVLIQKSERLETETDFLKFENTKRKNDASIATDDYNIDEKLTDLENEFRKVKTDLNNALVEAKKCDDLQNIENKLKNQISSMECEKEELKKQFEKTLQYAENRNNRVEKLKEENSKMKYKMKQLKNEIENLKRELKNALHNAERFCEISEMHDELKQKQKISELENNLEEIKEKFDAALIEVKSGNEIAIQLRFDNTKQKQQISELESEITKLTNVASALKKIHNDQDEHFKIIIELEKDKSALNRRLNDIEMSKSQILNENNNLKQKLQQQEMDIDKLNEAIKTISEERNQLSYILTKAKENEGNVKKLMESTNLKLDSSKTSQVLYEENLALNKKLKQMENENKTLTAIFQNRTCEIQKEGLTKLMKERIANFEKNNINIDADAIPLHKENSFDEFNEKKETENKKLKDILQKVKQELLETNNDRNKLKNLLLEQKRKSKDIKAKVDQVEVLINSERNKCKEEQMKKKALEAKINQLNEKFETVNTKLELKNLELIELKNKIEDLNKKELLVSNNKLSTITPNYLTQTGQSCELLMRDENTITLLRKITTLEEELEKNKKQAQQTVIAMQFAIKLEKHRILELKEKLEEERLKNKRVLDLQSQPIFSRSSDQSVVMPTQENEVKHRHITNKNSKLRIAEHRPKHTKKRDSSQVHEKLKSKTSMSSENLLKSQDETYKRHERCRSPSNTPVKDTNSLPSSTKVDKSPRLFFTK